MICVSTMSQRMKSMVIYLTVKIYQVVAKVKGSYTGAYLAPMLERVSEAAE